MSRSEWRVAYWILSGAFVLTAALNLLRVHAGFLTSYAADLCVPPWIYVVVRGLARTRVPRNPVARWMGRTPERAAASLFVASALSEVSQMYWPKGFFPGRFDPLDLVAYAAGLLACFLADRRSDIPVRDVQVPAE